MKHYGLFLTLGGLFSITVLALGAFLSWSVERSLTAEFQSRGKDIAESIASSSVDVILNHDLATLQSIVDECFHKTSGLSFIFVVDDQGDIVAHTFVPTIPDEILALRGDRHATTFR